MKSKGNIFGNNEDIQKYLGFNLKMLSFIGLKFTLNNDNVKKSKFLQKLPILLTNAWGIMTVFSQLVYIRYTFSRDTHLTSQICCEMFDNILCICKGFRIAIAFDNIQKLFSKLSVFWIKYRPNEYYSAEILNKAQKTLSFCKLYSGIVLSACVGFCLPPIQNIIFQSLFRNANESYDYSKRNFNFLYPFEINRASIYFSVLIEEECLLFVSGIYWISCDTLFAQFVTHTSLQLKILQYDIENLFNYESSEDSLKENIINFVKRHQGLLEICGLIENVFSPVIFATMLLIALNICVNFFEVKGMISDGDYAKATFYITCVMVLLFSIMFYCSFAETLSEETSLITDSIYSCNWPNKTHRLKFYFQMIQMRSQKPFHCTAYGFFPIGHKQFASVMNTSFSYLMMLQTMN